VLRRFGFSYDWRRKSPPAIPIYREHVFSAHWFGAASPIAKEPGNWVSKCCTVLANEQVVNGGYCWAA